MKEGSSVILSKESWLSNHFDKPVLTYEATKLWTINFKPETNFCKFAPQLLDENDR
jgi:hypothetical protein